MSKYTQFTKLDFFNITKYEEIRNNETIQTVLENLQRKNTPKNHLLVCQQLIGYLRCMLDMEIIDNNVYNDVLGDIKYMKSICNEILYV